MRTLDVSSFLSIPDFNALRKEKQHEIMALKAARRLRVGPFAFFHFECFETLWWQIQEMVRIEKGGADQLQEEITSYTPLLPQGSDWRACLMFEIPNEDQRRLLLSTLGHVEHTVRLTVDQDVVLATSTDPEDDRTTVDGKTSAVHFLKFVFSSAVRERILTHTPEIRLAITHPHYHHDVLLEPTLVDALRRDLAPRPS